LEKRRTGREVRSPSARRQLKRREKTKASRKGDPTKGGGKVQVTSRRSHVKQGIPGAVFFIGENTMGNKAPVPTKGKEGTVSPGVTGRTRKERGWFFSIHH